VGVGDSERLWECIDGVGDDMMCIYMAIMIANVRTVEGGQGLGRFLDRGWLILMSLVSVTSIFFLVKNLQWIDCLCSFLDRQEASELS
jgi:hypothetical protein